MAYLDDRPLKGTRSAKAYPLLIALIAAAGGFLFGYDLAIIAGANFILKEQFALSEAAFGFITTSALLGCIPGPFLGSWLCDALGRKKTLIIACLLLAASAIVTAVARDIVTFNVFRFVGGVGVGLCSVGSPMYIAEVAPARSRGMLGLMYQMAIVIGSILSAVTAYFLAKYLPETLSWRWMFGAETVAVVLYALLLFLLPESPRWLMARGQEGEAQDILTRIDGPEHARQEILEIKGSLVEETGTFREFLQPGIRKALTVGVLLAIFAQTTGWSVLAGYLPSLFQEAGVPEKAQAILQYVFAYGIMGVMTAVACVLVDRLGRKLLWVVGSAMMAVATGLMGMVYHYNITGLTVVAVACLCALPHAFALGPLPWLMMSELYPTKIRAKAVATSTTVLWATVSIMVWIFPIISEYFKEGFGSIAGAIWLFVLANGCSFVFGIKLLPETKGRTLENIAASFRSDTRGTGRL